MYIRLEELIKYVSSSFKHCIHEIYKKKIQNKNIVEIVIISKFNLFQQNWKKTSGLTFLLL